MTKRPLIVHDFSASSPWHIRWFRSLETVRFGPFQAAYVPGLLNVIAGVVIAVVWNIWWLMLGSLVMHLALSWYTWHIRATYGVEDVTRKPAEVLLVLAKSGNQVARDELMRRWNIGQDD